MGVGAEGVVIRGQRVGVWGLSFKHFFYFIGPHVYFTLHVLYTLLFTVELTKLMTDGK